MSRVTASLWLPTWRHLKVSVLLQAKGGLGFFEPMSLPAAGTPKGQGANKRKSMDLGARPDQDEELAPVHILFPCWMCRMTRMQQEAKLWESA